jgi:hypothetical protein
MSELKDSEGGPARRSVAEGSEEAVGQRTYPDLVRSAYEGEVFGEAFLRKLLDEGAHPSHRPALERLHRLEMQTRDRLRPLALRLCPHLEEADAAAAGESFAREAAAMSWSRFLQVTEEFATGALPDFEHMRGLGDTEDDDVLEEARSHEEALLLFARLELAGDPATARAALDDHFARSLPSCTQP